MRVDQVRVDGVRVDPRIGVLSTCIRGSNGQLERSSQMAATASKGDHDASVRRWEANVRRFETVPPIGFLDENSAARAPMSFVLYVKDIESIPINRRVVCLSSQCPSAAMLCHSAFISRMIAAV